MPYIQCPIPPSCLETGRTFFLVGNIFSPKSSQVLEVIMLMLLVLLTYWLNKKDLFLYQYGITVKTVFAFQKFFASTSHFYIFEPIRRGVRKGTRAMGIREKGEKEMKFFFKSSNGILLKYTSWFQTDLDIYIHTHIILIIELMGMVPFGPFKFLKRISFDWRNYNNC